MDDYLASFLQMRNLGLDNLPKVTQLVSEAIYSNLWNMAVRHLVPHTFSASLRYN